MGIFQQVKPDTKDAFSTVEDTLQDYFLPELLSGCWGGNPGAGFNFLPVKQVGMDLLDLIKTTPENCMTSCVITGNLIMAFWGQEEFKTAYHDEILC